MCNNHEVDATKLGNKIRFANHSDNPNCKSIIKNVIGDRKIGIYALHNIKKDDELFFNYGYSKTDKKNFKSPKKLN